MVYRDEINDICKLLRDDKVIICPTDTIWGLSCSLFSEKANRKIYDIKNREIGKPFIILVSDLDMLLHYIEDLHPRIETLLVHHRKPLTIVHNNPKSIPEYALANDGSVGIRIVQDEYCKKLIQSLNAPLVSTSANFSGDQAPGNYSEIQKRLLDEVDYISQYKREDNKLYKPSVIIKYDEEGQLEILRP